MNPDSVRRRNAFQTGSRELARFLRQNGEAFAQAQEAAEGDASGFAQAWMEDFDHRAGEVFNRIPSEVRALFGSDLEALRAESFAEADSFERDRRILAIQQGIGGTRDDYVELVGQEPARLDYAFQKMEEMIRASGLRPDLIEEEVLAARRAIFTSYRQARLAGPNPEALLREMEAGRFEGVVPPEELEALVMQTTAEVGQRQRAALMERQVDADTSQRLELQRLRAGEGGDPHITPDALRKIFPGEVGERKARHLEEELAVAKARGKYATEPAEERSKAYKALTIRVGTTPAGAQTEGLHHGADDETGLQSLAGSSSGVVVAEGPEPADAVRQGPDLAVEPEPDMVQLSGRIPEAFEPEPQTIREVDQEIIELQALADTEKSIAADSKQHVVDHFAKLEEVDANAAAARAYAKRLDLSPEQRRQARQKAARATQYAVGLSDARQTEIKGNDIGNRVLTKPDAVAKARELASLDFDGQVAWWLDIDEFYGPFADRVRNEVADANLMQEQLGTALLTLNGAEAGVIEAWGRAQSKTRHELEAEVRDPEGEHFLKDAARLVYNVRDSAREIITAFTESGREKELLSLLDIADRLSWQLLLDGKVADPVQKAFDSVFAFDVTAGGTLIHKDVIEDFKGLGGKGGINRALEFELAAMDEDVIGFSYAGVVNDFDFDLTDPQMEVLYADHVRGHGRWRTTCNGVQLVDGGGRPVRHKDGRFVTFTWDEIRTRAEERRRDRLRRTARRGVPNTSIVEAADAEAVAGNFQTLEVEGPQAQPSAERAPQ